MLDLSYEWSEFHFLNSLTCLLNCCQVERSHVRDGMIIVVRFDHLMNRFFVDYLQVGLMKCSSEFLLFSNDYD